MVWFEGLNCSIWQLPGMSCTMYIPAAPDVKGDKAKSNYCSLGAGGDAAGGWWGKGGFGERIAGGEVNFRF